MRKLRATEVGETPPMSAKQFRAWLRAVNLSQGAAAKALGVHRATITRYMHMGAPASIRLACRAIYLRQVEPVYPWEIAA